MYKYYCIKIILKNGLVGYYCGMDNNNMPMMSEDINDSCFYDTYSEAYDAYRYKFYGKGLNINGVGVSRYMVTEVTSKYPL